MKKAEQANFPAFEAEMLEAWTKENTFEKSVENRRGAKRYSFYDGPPFANGMPHFGHSLVTSIKDSLGRYHTMKGECVERRNGWDCHGLPVEFAIEKQFGVSGKKQILELGLDKFNDACRASVFKYKGEWEEFFRRIGRWTDTAHSYQSIDRDYTESVWWMLGQVHEKGLLYRGYKSMPYCPRCETPLSNFEVNEGYKDNVPDPSLFVKFRLVDEDAALLGWTTTPWSLPGNAAVAVKPGEAYVYVRVAAKKAAADGTEVAEPEVLIVAKKRLEAVFKDEASYEVLREVMAEELAGKRYKPVFELAGALKSEQLFRVWTFDEVSIEDGTGVLHVAPAFGEADLGLAEANGIPVLNTVRPDGHLTDDVPLESVRGKFFKGADRLIVEHLTERGKVWAAETFLHTYPFCYRCDSPLLYYAISTWFVKVSAIRETLIETAEEINWQPAHIKSGRFGKWLEGARDWAISRNRYWGAPMPIWVNVDDANDYLVVTSLEQLVELAGLKEKPEDVHRPGIDAYVIRTSDGKTHDPKGKTYKRVEEVFDCWFESGSMPVAQQHYPFENGDVFETSFPADYIGEGLDQTRLWFYVLHVLSTIAFGRPAYKNVLVNGMVMAADGQKLSKRLRNYPPVEEVFATEGADILRFYLLGNDQAVGADYMRFNREAMQDTQRNVFGTLWNTYSFLSMYAEIDGWEPAKAYEGGKLVEPTRVTNVLDRWMIARLRETTLTMTAYANDYQLAKALRPLRELIDDMSNWYVRRSRRRFWKGEETQDKASAYVTLHYVLCNIAKLLAPWSPFVSDKLWRGLTEGMDEAESVHLSDWPLMDDVEPGSYLVDMGVIGEMRLAREVVTEGLALRAAAKIKVRQPLASLEVTGEQELGEELAAIVAEEVNVKQVRVKHGKTDSPSGFDLELDTEITQELKAEGLMRDVVRMVQNARKTSGLEVDDRIVLSLVTDDEELAGAIRTHVEVIKTETLAVELNHEGVRDGVPVKVNGAELYIGVARA